jgi:hypothetical protein
MSFVRTKWVVQMSNRRVMLILVVGNPTLSGVVSVRFFGIKLNFISL